MLCIPWKSSSAGREEHVGHKAVLKDQMYRYSSEKDRLIPVIRQMSTQNKQGLYQLRHQGRVGIGARATSCASTPQRLFGHASMTSCSRAYAYQRHLLQDGFEVGVKGVKFADLGRQLAPPCADPPRQSVALISPTSCFLLQLLSIQSWQHENHIGMSM